MSKTVMPQLVACAAVVSDRRLLLIQRGPVMSHPGQWVMPGGKIEAGESPLAAAARELREETGMRGFESRAAYEIGQYAAADLSKRFFVFVFSFPWLGALPIPKLEPGFTGYGWFSAGQVLALGREPCVSVAARLVKLAMIDQ